MTTPTLLEASQALLKAAKQSVEWRLTGIGRPPEQLMTLEIEALEQVIAQEQSKTVRSSFRNCINCKHVREPGNSATCTDCKHAYTSNDNWEPKP